MEPTTLFVYILLCNNGAYYTGYTSDMERRYAEHLSGFKCKFTRSFKPLRIETYWKVRGGKGIAMKIEKYIKKLSKNAKKQLIHTPKHLQEIFPEYIHD